MKSARNGNLGGAIWCAVIRWNGGKHKWRDGKCARCGRRQSKPRVKKEKAT